MRRRGWFTGVSIGVAVLGVAWVADALVVTDEEQVHGFADGVLAPESADHLLNHCDVDRLSVTLISNGRRIVYGEGDELLLADAVLRELAFLDERREGLTLQSIDVDGEDATVALRAEGPGPVRYASFELERRGDGWLVERIRVGE